MSSSVPARTAPAPVPVELPLAKAHVLVDPAIEEELALADDAGTILSFNRRIEAARQGVVEAVHREELFSAGVDLDGGSNAPRPIPGAAWGPLVPSWADGALVERTTGSPRFAGVTISTEPPTHTSSAIGRVDYRASDAPLVEHMRELLDTGEASSIYGAALAVADKAEGHGSPRARAERLSKRYRERSPSRRTSGHVTKDDRRAIAQVQETPDRSGGDGEP